MVNNNDLKITDKKFVVPVIPKTETRIVLEQQDLYPDLGYEDISSGRGYGPCTSPNCRCSAEELQRQYWQNQLREQERIRNRTFRADLSTSGSYYFYTERESIKDRGYTIWDQAFNRIFQFGTLYRTQLVKIRDVNEARDFSRELQYGNVYVSYEGHGLLHARPQPDSGKTNRAIGYLNGWVNDYDNGNSVDRDASI